ncbi:MAG: twin-arginine translocation signal domain-containing protein [Anaerolineae bacterium]|nr:twin-arginine translocation signal domain-containing protein [Anaerolineae bacterium]
MKDEHVSGTLTRRQFIQGGAAATVGLLLAACGAEGNEPTTMASPNPTTPPQIAAEVSPTTAAADTPILSPTPACADDDDPTPAQTEGPYYTPDTPERTNFWEDGITGTRLLLTGKVLTTGCEPVAAALIDFWHCDANGTYDNVGYKLRGHQFTDANGNFVLDTVLPGLYPGRTRHIHVKVQGPNKPVLTTQLYFPDEPQNSRDGIYHPDLLMTVQATADGMAAVFDFVLR